MEPEIIDLFSYICTYASYEFYLYIDALIDIRNVCNMYTNKRPKRRISDSDDCLLYAYYCIINHHVIMHIYSSKNKQKYVHLQIHICIILLYILMLQNESIYT